MQVKKVWIVSERFIPEELWRFGCARFANPSPCINVASAYSLSCECCWLCSLQGDFQKTVYINKKRGNTKKDRKRWRKKLYVEKSTCLWRVSVKDFNVWQKPYSLTLIAEGHLWCTYTWYRLQGPHCWERKVTFYSRLQAKVWLYVCGCVHSSSQVKGWLRKLTCSYLLCEIQIISQREMMFMSSAFPYLHIGFA